MKTNVTKNKSESAKKVGFFDLTCYLGGAIVFLGVAILLRQNCLILRFLPKIIATLGFGVAAYSVGVLFKNDDRYIKVSTAFFIIFALVSPIGLWVELNHLAFDAKSSASQTLISGVMLSSCLFSLLYFRNTLFIFFSIVFATWFVFSVTDWMIGIQVSYRIHEFYKYRVLLMSISYILLGYFFSSEKKMLLASFLYAIGSFCFLMMALVLTGWSPEQNMFWELIYPALTFLMLSMSFLLKSNTLLTSSMFFLMLYILKITGEYFSESLGWPICLMITGLIIIGLSSLVWHLKHKRLSLKNKISII